MRRRIWFSIIGVIAVAAIVIGINMFADARLANLHVDLTRSHIYTLSDGTRQILSDLKEPITLRLFYSRRLGSTVPVYGTYADHVREMLGEYAAVSGGKIRLEFYDPEPFSDTEDRALAYGLQGVPVDQGGVQVYFGLAGSNLEDDERTIAFFQPERERFLEYDLTKLIYDLSNPKRPVIGVMSSLPLDGDPRAMMMAMRGQPAAGGQPYASTMLLRQTNQVKTVNTDAQVIDPDIQVLLVAEAQNLSDATLYAIDQFVMRGGRLMVMVDPWSEAMAAAPSPNGMPPTDTGSNLKKLFDAWGIVFDPTKVVGDLTGAWRVRANADERVQAVNYVAWFNIRDGINHDDPATADLQQVTVASCRFARQGAECVDRVHAAADQQRTLGRDRGRSGEDAEPVEGAGGVQAGRRPAGDRGAHPRRAEVGLHRTAGTGEGPEAAGELSRLQGADRRPGQPRRGRRQRHPGRPVLGAHLRLLRPADRDAVQRQRTVRRQSDRHAGRRRRADRAALARRHQPSVRPGQPDAERGGSKVPPDRAGVAEAPGRHREAASRAAPGTDRQRPGQRAGGDHAGAARRDRRRAQGHRRYATAVARGAVRPEPRHLAAGDRACACSTSCWCRRCWRSWRSCSASCAAAVARGHGHETPHPRRPRRRRHPCHRRRLVFRHRRTARRAADLQRRPADVPRSRAEAAGCRADRDHPPGQDHRHREARRHLGPGRSRRLRGAGEQAARHADRADRAPPGRTAHHRSRAVQPARSGRPATARPARRTCCACSTRPASRSSR